MDKSLRVAFIAKYAPPLHRVTPVETIDENAVYAKYHFDIYSILYNEFPNLITGTDATCLFEHHDKIDYVFSLLNRAPHRNSEVFLSALAEYYNIPYLGARPNIRALAEDKHLAKIMALQCGLNTPKWITCDVGECLPITAPFSGTYFVKPRYGASSQFIDESSICSTWDDVSRRVNYLHEQGQDSIIEEFVDGVYFSSPVIFKNRNPIVLPPIKEESTLKGNVVTYKQKRLVDGGLTRSVETDRAIIRAIEDASTSFACAIRPIDYTRVDFIQERSGKLHFLEFNVCCNLGIQSAFTLSAKSAGYSHSELVLSILQESLERQNIW